MSSSDPSGAACTLATNRRAIRKRAEIRITSSILAVKALCQAAPDAGLGLQLVDFYVFSKVYASNAALQPGRESQLAVTAGQGLAAV